MPSSILLTVGWLELLMPLVYLWRGWRNSALRYVLVWAILAVFVNAVTALAGVFIVVPLAARHLALLFALAVPVAVLGAREPGSTAWNFVVVGFVAIGVLPVLQQPWYSVEWQLDGLYLTLMAVILAGGWLNYVPTRLSIAVSAVAWALAWQLAVLSMVEGRPHLIRIADACTVAGVLLAGLTMLVQLWQASKRCATTPTALVGELTDASYQKNLDAAAALDRFNCTWRCLRDGWGLVWAWRIRELVERAARHAQLRGEFRWSGLRLDSDKDNEITPAQMALAGSHCEMPPGKDDVITPTDQQKPTQNDTAEPTTAEAVTTAEEWWRLLQAVARRFAPPV